jgi:hypothetical protein
LAVRQRIKDSTKDSELSNVQYQDLAFKLLINIDRYDFHRFSAALHTWDRVETSSTDSLGKEWTGNESKARLSFSKASGGSLVQAGQ